MPKLEILLSPEEVHRHIPYAVICMTRYGAVWGTMKRKRRWLNEFTERERRDANRLFVQSHKWLLSTGVTKDVRMSLTTYELWQKLGGFCASI